MTWLNRVVDLIRGPIDRVKNRVCEEDDNSPACGLLSSLSERMGGVQTQKQFLIVDYCVRQAIAEMEAERGTAPQVSHRTTVHGAVPRF